MGRSIRFRAWDKDNKRMWFPVAISANGDSSPFFIGLLTEDRSNDPIMQYTGLKDKNDKQIYEGDIVGVINDKFGLGKHEYWSVEYDESEAKYVVFNQINSIRGFSCDTGNPPVVDIHGEQHFVCEVIGNIYENSELLKGDK
jgi:uncharacterized phage protein (TIGR01671 family)